MAEREGPRVVLRGPNDGDAINLPMDGLQARIIRKASRSETSGHWALGEAWQDAGFENPPHSHDEAEAFYVLEGEYTFYADTDPQRESGQAPSSSSRQARFIGSAPAHKVADFFSLAVYGRNRVLRQSRLKRGRGILEMRAVR